MSDDPSTPEVWSADRLMGKQVSFKGMSENGTTHVEDATSSPRRRKSKVDSAKIDPMLWGRPGHLTEEDCQIFVSSLEQSTEEKEGNDESRICARGDCRAVSFREGWRFASRDIHAWMVLTLCSFPWHILSCIVQIQARNRNAWFGLQRYCILLW